MLSQASELTCQLVVELVTEYLEDALGRPERARFEAHVADCAGCDAYLGQMRTTIALLRSLGALDGGR